MKKKLQQKKRNSRALWEKQNRIFENRFKRNEKLHKKNLKRLALCFLTFILVPVMITVVAFIFYQL